MSDTRFRAWDGECMMTNLDSVTLSELNAGVIYDGDGPEDCATVTIMQFTGFKDKNGKEICQKDIFAMGTERYVVNKRSGCFMADNIRNGHSLTHAREDVRVWHTLMESSLLIEVLGNIYENPELMDKT
ncbi:hypothetical protein LCGC14_2898630 [marine sediment metagenome]|uniref:YopX protein domain-containing protein n=1 Tax=marine sediment metagenome TaxID=412755 RepID=A0A0F8XV47_9ZZZZ